MTFISENGLPSFQLITRRNSVSDLIRLGRVSVEYGGQVWHNLEIWVSYLSSFNLLVGNS